MQIRKMSRYALIAMGYIAKHGGGRYVLSHEIAEAFNLPPDCLLITIKTLSRRGLLTCKRGPGGGCKLAKPAQEISLLDIIETVDGPMERQYIIAEDAPRQRFAVRMDAISQKATERLKAVLSKAKLSELVK